MVTGVDSSLPAVATAVKLAEAAGLSARAQFRCLDAAQSLPFPDGSFHAVACMDALGQLRDRPRIFVEWARVLKSGGRLLFTDHVLTGAISNVELADRTPFGYFIVAPDGYNEKLLGQAGFHLLQRVDLTSPYIRIAERHCAARAAKERAIRSVEDNEEFDRQSRYREVGAVLAREGRISHFAYLADRPFT